MNHFNAYNAYKTANATTLSKTRQVVMLYDGMVKFMQQVKVAIECGKIEERFHLCNKVNDVLIGLQGSLDFAQGGHVAEVLYEYYNDLMFLLMNVQQSNSLNDCDEIIRQLQEMAAAWRQVDAEYAREKAAGSHNAAPSVYSGIASSSALMDHAPNIGSLLGATV